MCTAWGGQNTGGGGRDEPKNSSGNARKQSASFGVFISKVLFFLFSALQLTAGLDSPYLPPIYMPSNAYEIQSTNFTLGNITSLLHKSPALYRMEVCFKAEF